VSLQEVCVFRPLSVMIVLALAAAPGVALAQTSGLPGGGFGNEVRDPRQSVFRNVPTDEQLAGPMSPVGVRQLFELDSVSVAQYEAGYTSHMATTAAERDSARILLNRFYQEMERRDRGSALPLARDLQVLGKNLDKADRKFEDKELKPLLSKSQWEDYRNFRKALNKAAADERQQYGGRRPPR